MSSKAFVNKQNQKHTPNSQSSAGTRKAGPKATRSIRPIASTAQAVDRQLANLNDQLQRKQNVARRRTQASQANMSVYATQLALPGLSSNPRVLPNSTPSQVCARSYRRVVDVAQADSTHLRCVMFPDLYNPGYISNNTTVVIPNARDVISLSGSLTTTTADNAAAPNYPQTVFKAFSENASAALSMSTGTALGDFSGGTGYGRGFPCNIASGSLMTISAHNVSNTKTAPTISIGVQYYDALIATSEIVYKAVVSQGETVTYTATVPVYTGNRLHGLFFVIGNEGKVETIKLSCSFTSGQFSSGAATGFAPAFAEQIIEENISHGRVTAMSIFCQCTTAMQFNSGNINVGRVPYTFNPIGNISEQLSALPNNRRYQGKFVDGAYVNWLPSQLEECEVNEIPEMSRILDTAEFLVLEIPNWVVGATARLEFVWSVEFYTPNQNFEKILTPPRTPEWNALYYAMLSLDAGHCNPDHVDRAKEYIAKVTRGLAQASQWYSAHADTLKAAGEAVATGLALLLA